MKTVLISADGAVPGGLREIVERGSTDVAEYLASELSDRPQPDADRFVFWSGSDQPALRGLADSYLRGAAAETRDAIMYIHDARQAGSAPPEMTPEQLFAWPGDEDRLKVAFLTGA